MKKTKILERNGRIIGGGGEMALRAHKSIADAVFNTVLGYGLMLNYAHLALKLIRMYSMPSLFMHRILPPLPTFTSQLGGSSLTSVAGRPKDYLLYLLYLVL